MLIHIVHTNRYKTLQIGSAAAESIRHNYLGLRKITYRWIPHLLTEAQKQDRVDYCLAMLKKFDSGSSKRVITGDESWFYYYDPETNRPSEVWVARNDPSPTKVRRQRSVGNFLYEIRFYCDHSSCK